MRLSERCDAPGRLIYKIIQKAYKREKGLLKGPRKRRRMTPEAIRLRDSKRRKALRQSRRSKGLCAYCGQVREEPFKMCSSCRSVWRTYNERARTKRSILASYASH